MRTRWWLNLGLASQPLADILGASWVSSDKTDTGLVTRELVCSLSRPSSCMYRKAQDQLVDLSECLICEDVPFHVVEWLGGGGQFRGGQMMMARQH